MKKIILILILIFILSCKDKMSNDDIIAFFSLRISFVISFALHPLLISLRGLPMLEKQTDEMQHLLAQLSDLGGPRVEWNKGKEDERRE